MRAESPWIYARRVDGLEQAVCRGDGGASLAKHFHEQAQIAIVLAGVLRFFTPIGPIAAHAGETVVIGPLVPHKPLDLDATGTSVTPYVPLISKTAAASRLTVVATPRWLRTDQRIHQETIAGWVADRMVSTSSHALIRDATDLAALVANSDLAIGALATKTGITREGFIRRFRNLVGMTPHAYRVATRLNAARALLAANVPPVETAVDTGFADQSHLGRTFKLLFGTTPNAYRLAMR